MAHWACDAVRVLLLDDEPAFRESLAEGLRDDGHEVLDYSSPSMVPSLEELGPVHVLVTDLDMPGLDGLAFVDRLRVVHPDVPCVLVTAYRTATVRSSVAARSRVALCHKPVEYEELHALVHRVVESADLRG